MQEYHNYYDNNHQDYYMPGLELYLALVLIKISYQAPHTRRHLDFLLSCHFYDKSCVGQL